MENRAQRALLVATDFSARAEYAVDYGAALSRQKDYELFLLHVFNPEVRNGHGLAEHAYGHARRLLEGTIDKYSSKYLIEINGMLETGNIFTAIHETARKIQADMLVMPMHRKVGIQKLVGRFAFRIIATSPVPVMVVQHSHEFRGIGRLLVPLDLSRPFDENLDQAIRFASHYNSTLVIYTVTGATGSLPAFILKRELAHIKSRVGKHGLQCETHLVQKPFQPVYRHIVDQARKERTDAILLLARSEDNHDHLFIGGTAGRVIENAEVPVVVFAPVSKFKAPKVIPSLLRKMLIKG